MRHLILIIITSLTFASCDCVQQVTGIVLDRQTKEPIRNVSLGKYEREDTGNSFSRRIYSDDSGRFNYRSVSGGFRDCPDLVLYFSKPGYKTAEMTFDSFTHNDTVFLDKTPFNRDSSLSITLKEFDKQIDDCISWFQTKQLSDISDGQHVQIMMCLNTIFMRHFKGGHYEQLKQISEDKNYTRDIIKVYSEWVPNRGMGFYFPKLQMELYGTPMRYAIYNVTK